MIAYQKKVVCFLDILGFKKHIQNSTKSTENFSKLLKAIEIIKEYKSTEEYFSVINESQMITQFSDCIVVSFDITEPSQVFYTVLSLQYLIVDLLNHDILVRGGIAYGDCVHTNDMLFGPALVEAYELESVVANYPRVILQESIINETLKYPNALHTQEEEKQYLESCLGKDSDGLYYVDYFHIGNELDSEYDYPIYLQGLFSIITNGLDTDNISIKAKYLWMREKYNIAVESISRNIDNFQGDQELKEAYKSLELIK